MPTPPALTADRFEIVRPEIARGPRHAVLFDFDGTLSLIREGWQAIMIPMMVEILAELRTGESEEELTGVVREFVARLTGKQTIYQMIELASQVRARGGSPEEPLAYKHQYLDRLWGAIRGRVEALKSGAAAPDDHLVPGSRRMLELLRDRGIRLFLASGTDLPYVRDEARSLQIDHFFGDDIYGALDDYKKFSKAIIIQKIIADHRLAGPQFLAFGDGYVVIENTQEVGGTAIGLATDEAERRGIDEWKRSRLIAAGADAIAPDFRDAEIWLPWLLGE